MVWKNEMNFKSGFTYFLTNRDYLKYVQPTTIE